MNVFLFSKDKFSLENLYNREVNLKKEEFLELTKRVCFFRLKLKVGHPCHFPIEFPYRL
ncbi:MAG: hypothetical protein NZ927_03145 [Candidatus Calescibacterium sp.]|nr:hypothetical protein [Candidatus Calescibacterium sp.]